RLHVVPRDGLRARFAQVTADKRVVYELDRDGFLKDAEITVDKNTGTMAFTVENRSGDAHTTNLAISSIFNDIRDVRATIDGKRLKAIAKEGHSFEIQLPLQRASHRVEINITYAP